MPGRPPTAPLASVVVPAHQEAGTIARCLRALLGDARPGELEVVVAANGCSDGTADRARDEARRLGHDIVVLDLPEAGKAAALRAAERVCTILPRLYVDADVECPTATVRALVAALADPGDDGAAADVAVPTRVLDLNGASRGARAYYRTWQDLPWVREQLAGRGVVALGARARATFDELPDVVADDRWLTTRVPRERAVVVAAPVVVRPPRRLADVLRVRRRVYRGNCADEVAAHDAALGQRTAVVSGLLRSPASAAGTLLFLAVTLLAKLPSRDAGWGRDASRGGTSRVVQSLPRPRRSDVPRPGAARSVGVVVVTHRSAAHVVGCLDALDTALEGLSARVVVVDNASPDDSCERVLAWSRRTGHDVRLVPRDVNDGFAAGVQAGAAELRDVDELLLVNPDVRVSPGSVRALLDAAARYPRAGVVGGRAVDADGRTDPHSWWGRPSLWSTFCFATGLSSAFPGSRRFDPESSVGWDGSAREVDVISGGFVLVSRGAWDELDGLDRTFLLYGEDADLCLRARAAGWAPRVAPDAVFRHDVGGSSEATSRTALVMRGRVTVLRRHLPRGTRTIGVRLLELGVLLRSAAAGGRGARSAGRRARTSTAAWQVAWRTRRTWRRGWRPGDRLERVPPTGRRVLVVVQNLPLVLDRRVRTECRALLDAGYGVTVICPKATPDEPDVHDLDGVLVRSYPATGTTSGVASYVAEFVQCWLQTAVHSWRAWRHEGFDVIQACNPPDTYWALGLLWKVAGKRFVFDQHDLSPEVYEARFGRRGLLHRLLVLLEAATYRTADHVISTNPEYQQVARERGRIPAERCSVVMSTPDVAMLRTEVEPSRRAGRRHLVCYVGIMGPQDGVGRLLAAVDHYVHVLGRDDAHFALLGFGDSLADLRRDARDRGLDAWVTFTGRVDHAELGRWLSTAAIGVTPDPVNEFNHRSTMNKTLEYMAHGVPVVATDLRETRRCAQDAAVYAADGDPIRLAELVAELLDDPLRRRRMGRLGRLRIERDLAWRHQAATYVSVFDRLLGVTRPPGRVAPPGRDVRNPAVGALPRATIDSTEPDRAPVTVGEH